jgi:hypothetical protein
MEVYGFSGVSPVASLYFRMESLEAIFCTQWNQEIMHTTTQTRSTSTLTNLCNMNFHIRRDGYNAIAPEVAFQYMSRGRGIGQGQQQKVSH